MDTRPTMLSARLPRHLVREMERFCVDRGILRQHFVKQAIANHLEKCRENERIVKKHQSKP